MKIRGRARSDDVRWLEDQPWWRDLPRSDLERLAALGERRRVASDHLLMLTGEVGAEVVLIISGEVTVSRSGRVIAWLGPGEVVGELSVLDHVPRNADVRTASPVELLVFHDEGLEAAMSEIEPMRQHVIEAAARHRG